MKILCYSLYGLWAVSAIVLKILGLCSWIVALSWLWFPLAIILCFLTFINASVWIGGKLKEREEAKIPDSCSVCLFGQTASYSPDNKCLGEVLDESCKMGTLCKCYKRNIQR